jgi:hypothetical protein
LFKLSLTAFDATSLQIEAWRARSGQPELLMYAQFPRRHVDAQGVALVIPAAAAAELPLEVEQPGVRRPAVLQQSGVDVGPLSAGGTGGEDHMPGSQVAEPDGIARRDILVLFHIDRELCQSGLTSKTGKRGP